MKTVACLIARTNSSRLPDKVLKDVGGRKMIEHIIDRMKMVPKIDEIVLCTSTEPGDQRLQAVAEENDIGFHAGSLESPTERMLQVGERTGAVTLIRVTGDNIFTDPVYVNEMICLHHANHVEYTRIMDVPLGLGVDVIDHDMLSRCYKDLTPEQSEYLMLYIFRPDKFRCQVLFPEPALAAPQYSVTVDTQDDLERSRFIVESKLNKKWISYPDILELHRTTGIPHFEFAESGEIKYPGGRIISFDEFMVDMDGRVAQSLQTRFEQGHYASAIGNLRT